MKNIFTRPKYFNFSTTKIVRQFYKNTFPKHLTKVKIN